MTEESIRTNPDQRLKSLDTLRGFDMFWIIGGEAFLVLLTKATNWNWLKPFAAQMHHSHWVGFHFYDLIFPLFMFISGVAIPFAITGKLQRGVSKSILTRKVFRRMILLVIFGFIYNGALRDGFSDMRAASVLAQIGLAYFFTALIVIYSKNVRTRIIWLAGILAVIAILQLLVPVAGFGPGVLTAEGSINSWIDQHFLPGHLYGGTYDPEGLLCIVSATSVTLLGSLAGYILRNKEITPQKKTNWLLISGVVLVIIALILSPVYPIIKKVWTVPFNLLTAGISFLLITLFYYVIDVKGWNNWTLFFRVIGLNSITIYLGRRIIDFNHMSEFLLGWLSKPAGVYGPVIIIIGVLIAEWYFLYYLYKNKIFLRV